MSKIRSWTDDNLILAVQKSRSYRMVLLDLGLVPAGGNYIQIKQRIAELGLSVAHFSGKGWNKGGSFVMRPAVPLEQLLVQYSGVQSYKLKKKLFAAGLKEKKCELCGWAQMTEDGRIPLELDHKNGDHSDNRLENLRILCPNCHSLQPTHRGRNKGRYSARVVERYTRDT